MIFLLTSVLLDYRWREWPSNNLKENTNYSGKSPVIVGYVDAVRGMTLDRGDRVSAIYEPDMTDFTNPPLFTNAVPCSFVNRVSNFGYPCFLPIVCCHDLALPPLKRTADPYPVFLVRSRNEVRDGRWLTIRMENDAYVYIFASSLLDIYEYTASICSVCTLCFEQCACGGRTPTPTDCHWQLACDKFGEIHTQRDLSRALGSKKCSLSLCVEPDAFILQSKKTYVLQPGDARQTYTLQNSKSWESILTEPEQLEPIVKIVEDSLTLYAQMKRSRNIFDISLAIGAFTRSLTGRSNVFFLKDILEKVGKDLSEYFVLQSDGHWTEALSDVYDNYSRCKDSELSRRIKSVFNHLVMHCVYFKLGIAVDTKLFYLLEKQKIKATLVDCYTFVDAVVALTVFLLKHGRQCMIAGSLEPFFMDGDSVTAWFTDSKKLESNFEFLSNPAAVGIDLHGYLHDLDSAIDRGKSLIKFLPHNSNEQKLVMGMNLKLDTMRKRYLSSSAASAVRKQPLGVVVYGTPGTGKSTVMSILFDFDARRRGRSRDPAFKFQFCAETDYMDNFRSWMHTIVLDDVAQHNPGKIPGVDPTLGLFIRIANNQGWCAPQAALEDKGKTPVLIDLLLVSTNKDDMNVPLYYPATYAVFRRVPIRIEPVVKEQYRKEASSAIDPEKAIDSGVYPNFWDWHVSLAKQSEPGSQRGGYVPFKVFTEISEFLQWFGVQSDIHHRQQTAWLASANTYKDATFCDDCNMPINLCECVTTQGMRTRPDGTRYYAADYDKHGHFEVEATAIFDVAQPNITRPWRHEYPIREPRVFDTRMTLSFIKNTRLPIRKLANEYALSELPLMLSVGATNDEIADDFHGFVKCAEELKSLQECEDVIELLLTNIGEELGIGKKTFLDHVLRFFIVVYFSSIWFRNTVSFFGRFALLRRWFLYWFRPCLVKTDNQKHIMQHLGKSIDSYLGGNITLVGSMLKWLAFATAGSLITVLVARVMDRFNAPPAPKAESFQTPPSEVGDCCSEVSFGEVSDRESVYEAQVLRSTGIFPPRAKGDEKINPWGREDRDITTLDFQSNRTMTTDALTRKLAYNVVRFVIRSKDDGGTFLMAGHVIAISNEVFITNNHSVPMDAQIQFTFSLGGSGHVRSDVCALILQEQVTRFPMRDLCIIRTKALPAVFKDIRANFVSSDFRGIFEGFYLLKRSDGSIEKKPVSAIHKTHTHKVIDSREYHMESYCGSVNVDTESGDCGAPLVAETGYGPVILGFHSMFCHNSRVTTASMFSLEDFEGLVTSKQVQVGVIRVDPTILIQRDISYIDFHDEGKLMYHGELNTFRTRPKHSVVDSELSEQLYGSTIGEYEIQRKLTTPVMDNWRAQQLSLKEFIDPVNYLNEVYLERIKAGFMKHILKNLPDGELDLLCPVELDVAVNGVPGMAYMDSVKGSTSMGDPYHKPKRKYLVPLDDPRWPDGKKFIPEVEANMEAMLESLLQGIRVHAIFTAHLKNEPVSFKKQRLGKTRVFFGGPGELLVLVRMFFMSFCRVVQRNARVFFCAVGMNTTSTEWDKLYHYLAENGVDRAIAGDYEFYDKKIKMLLVRIASELIIELCEKSGNFPEEYLLAMKTLMMDLANPTVNYFGMLMTLLGGEVSGHQFTTILNCIVNIFYLAYAWLEAGYDIDDFFEFIRAVVLGDDHAVTVAPQFPKYTHTHITNVMRSVGVGYTMADKSSESVPYINLSQVTFLKRSFKYSEELGVVLGPLDVESIFKMLVIQTASKVVSIECQLAQALYSASMESFFHGRSFFDDFHKRIDSLTKSFKLESNMKLYPFMEYEQHVRRFWAAGGAGKAVSVSLVNQKHCLSGSDCFDSTLVLQSSKRMDQRVLPARAFPEIRVYESLELETKENYTGEWSKFATPPDNHRLSKTNEQTNTHSSAVPETEGSEVTQVGQTTFVNETVPLTLDLAMPHDRTARSQIVPDPLAQYLSRPAKIFTYTWAENAAPGTLQSFNPWSLYFNNVNISNKLASYNLLRCTLHLKFTINASQFYYGCIGAFYTPASGFLRDTTGGSLGYSAGTQVLISQKPHVWLDPQSTSVSEMKLPFVYHKNWVETRLLNNLTNLGQISLVQYAALRSANGVTTAGVNIVVYAWAEDVEITALTSTTVLQSKKEYVANGQISGIASTVSSIAKRLEDAPVIGPFAKATNVVASAIGGVASFFGFTNVPNVRDVEPMKSVAFHTLASSAISEPINKLSLQPKQEVSIDSSMLGDPFSDQLHIANFCQRESFLCGALWTTTSSEDAILFTSAVTPELYEKSSGTNYSLYNTPMAHLSRLFSYWRGDIIFRFKVIKTQYHRGRLNICWDAGVTTANLMPGYGNPSVMNMVFDLEDADEIEVRVPYMGSYPFFLLADSNENAPVGGPYWSNGPAPTFPAPESNGIIQLRVINRLTAPEASSDVDILVFVRAAENIEFAAPRDLPNTLTSLVLQSDKQYVTQDFGNPSVSHPDTYLEVFGEKIVSLRELLHRSSKAYTGIIPRTGNWNGDKMTFYMEIQRLPRKYGYTPSGWNTGAGTLVPGSNFPFNYCKNHPINWVVECFVGYKGSVNYTFNTSQYNSRDTVALASTGIVRCSRVPAEPLPHFLAIPSAFSTSQNAKELNCGDFTEKQGGSGLALTNQYTQTGLSANLPYYSRSEMFYNNSDNVHKVSGTLDESHLDWFEYVAKRGIVANTPDNDFGVDVYCGTGPDFNAIFFLNCPVVRYLAPPAPLTTG